MKRLFKRIDLFPNELRDVIRNKYKNDFPSFVEMRDEERRNADGSYELFQVIYLNGTNTSIPIYEKVFGTRFWDLAVFTDSDLKRPLLNWLIFHMTMLPSDESKVPLSLQPFIKQYRPLFILRISPVSVAEKEINAMRLENWTNDEYDRDFLQFINEIIFQVKFLTIEI